MIYILFSAFIGLYFAFPKFRIIIFFFPREQKKLGIIRFVKILQVLINQNYNERLSPLTSVFKSKPERGIQDGVEGSGCARLLW